MRAVGRRTKIQAMAVQAADRAVARNRSAWTLIPSDTLDRS